MVRQNIIISKFLNFNISKSCPKNVGSRKQIWTVKSVCPKHIFGPKKLLGKKNWVQKNLYPKKNPVKKKCGSERIFGT